MLLIIQQLEMLIKSKERSIMRQRIGNVNRDKRIFSTTARKSISINAVQMINRGGIRL